MKVWIAGILLMMVAGCSFHQHDKSFYRDIPLQMLSEGMSKNAVFDQMGKPYRVIASKTYDAGIVDVWEYRKYALSEGSSDDPLVEQYGLYFWNAGLAQWGPPGDWEKEADSIRAMKREQGG